MVRRILLSCTVLMAAACSANPPADGKTAPNGAATGQTAAVARTDGAAAQARSEKDSNEVYEFEYSYPAEAAQYPQLKELLDKRLNDARSELAAEGQKGKKDAEANGYPYRTYAGATAWKTVTQTPQFLSLSAEVYAYSGGAHGMTVFDTLLWDKEANTAREPSDLFTSKDALRDAIRQPFCKALDNERSKKRGGVDWKSDEMFSECIDPTESTIILGSSNGKAFDRVGILVEPYAAGPYAEGSYDVTVPVTAAVLNAVKPAYRGVFAIGR